MFEKGLDIRMHGGQCCGIKVICGFLNNPWDDEGARKAGGAIYLDANGGSYNVTRSFFWEEAPKEPAWARFNRYMDFLSRVRPKGLVEITTTLFQGKWVPLIEAAGFKAVATFKNSNSNNMVTVYHFVMGVDKFTPIPEVVKPEPTSMWKE